MGFGKFMLYLKSASMLQAQQGIAQTQFASFHAFKDTDRQKFMRDLRTASTQFLELKVKDYREVMKNLALSLMGRK